MAGIDRQGTADKGCALFQPPRLCRGHPRIMQRVKIARVTIQNRQKASLSCREVAPLQQGNRLGKLLLNGAGWLLHLSDRAPVRGIAKKNGAHNKAPSSRNSVNSLAATTESLEKRGARHVPQTRCR